MHGVSVMIGYDLKFDVMRIENQFLNVNGRISKRLLCLGARGVKSLHQTRVVMRRAHAATAATGNGFDHDRIADFFRDLDRFLFVLNDSVASRRHWHARFASAGARRIFVAHQIHRARGRPDEFNPATFADFGKVRVLGKKTVTGMNRIDVAHFRRAHDAIDFQITFRTRRRADANGFIC